MKLAPKRGGSLLTRLASVLAYTLFVYLIMRFDLKVGGFAPKLYKRQVVGEFRLPKIRRRPAHDPGLHAGARRALSDRLAAAARDGIARYGLHQQDAAMMTCFTPSALRSDHVHFIDGARGGYASAATALKAMLAAASLVSGPRPGLAAAERADAAFDPQRVGAGERRRCSHRCCRRRHCRSGRTICSGLAGCMPLNSGNPSIGRLASAGLGFLLSVAGWPVAVSWGSRSQTMTPQMPPPQLLIFTRASPAWVSQVPLASAL